MNLLKENSRSTYFLNVPEEISSTFQKPPRGFYTKVIFYGGDAIWLDGKEREIQSKKWIDYLEENI